MGIGIYDDRMEIFNNGELPPGLSLDKIKAGFSDPRNPLIANVLFRGNLIEAWGRGVPNIISTCVAADNIEPEFLIDEAEFKITFRFSSTIKPPIYLGNKEVKEFDSLTPRQKKL